MRIILRLQHLVLPYISDGDGFALGVPPDIVDNLRRQKPTGRFVIENVALAGVFQPVTDSARSTADAISALACG